MVLIARLTGAVLLLQLAVAACKRTEPATDTSAQAQLEEDRNAGDTAIGYQRGDWWGVDLSSLILSARHIVISHRDAGSTRELLSCPSNTRGKAEALRLAMQLSRELASAPAGFTDAARRYSDEPVTAALGGSLGVFTAMAVPAAFVDAFGNLNEEQVSRPVETEQGYHVLQRLRVPEPQQLGFAHIVINYEGAVGWRRTDREVASRSRQAARQIAQRIADQAQQQPDAFGRLAMQYSDADDARLQGERGVWSTYEADDYDFMLLSVAAQLRVGDVSGPLELASGVHIVQRRSVTPEENFAASVITIGHAGSQLSRAAPEAQRSYADAQQRAERLAREIRANPERFDSLRSEYCDGAICGLSSWRRGHGLADLESALGALNAGDTTQAPIDTPVGFLIVRREDASEHPPAPLPAPRFTYPFFEAALTSGAVGADHAATAQQR